MQFDPYQEWLSINVPSGSPRTHYDLLGLAPFEVDPLRIQQAAMDRTALVRRYQLGRHAEAAMRLLAELAAAFDQLNDPLRKQAYDEQLQRELASPTTPSKPFDPYQEWLNLPAESSARSYYDLLGLQAFEDDPNRIRQAALERAALVRRHQAGPHGAATTRLLAELAAAYSQLGHPEGKRTYDAELRRKLVSPLMPANRLGYSLGVAVMRRGRQENVVVVAGNSLLPACGSQFFRLDELRAPLQRRVVVRILAGEWPAADGNSEAGRIKLVGIPSDADDSLLVHVTIVATQEDAFATALETGKGRFGHTRLRPQPDLLPHNSGKRRAIVTD